MDPDRRSRQPARDWDWGRALEFVAWKGVATMDLSTRAPIESPHLPAAVLGVDRPNRLPVDRGEIGARGDTVAAAARQDPFRVERDHSPHRCTRSEIATRGLVDVDDLVACTNRGQDRPTWEAGAGKHPSLAGGQVERRKPVGWTGRAISEWEQCAVAVEQHARHDSG